MHKSPFWFQVLTVTHVHVVRAIRPCYVWQLFLHLTRYLPWIAFEVEGFSGIYNPYLL